MSGNSTAVVKKKNANIELMRILSMFFIIILHALGKGGLIQPFTSLSPALSATWLLESISIIAVNLFMLISGYLLVNSRFKTGRLLEIICQVLFYSIGIFVIMLILGNRYNLHDSLICLFPLHGNVYWFLSAYVIMYLFFPLLALGIKHVSKEKLGILIIFLLIYESLFKSFLPIRLEGDKMGYDVVWYLIMFLVAAYIRLYGLPILKKPVIAYIVHICSVFLIFAESYVTDVLNYKLGRLTELHGIALEYNHVFVFISAVSLFMVFLNLPEVKGIASKIIIFIAPLSLGVYLIHEHPLLRYEWQSWFGIQNLLEKNAFVLVLSVLGTAAVIFVVCAGIDYIRMLIFKGIKKLFKDSRLVKFMKKIDAKMAVTQE